MSKLCKICRQNSSKSIKTLLTNYYFWSIIILMLIVAELFGHPHLLGSKKEEKKMAKRIHDTKEVMRERNLYPNPGPGERGTGQDLHSRSNGKGCPGGPRSEGKGKEKKR